MAAIRQARLLNRDRQTLLVAVVVVVQAIAAVFFVADALGDVAESGITLHIVIEGLIAVALLTGVFLGAWHMRLLLAEAQRREEALVPGQPVERGVGVDEVGRLRRPKPAPIKAATPSDAASGSCAHG